MLTTEPVIRISDLYSAGVCVCACVRVCVGVCVCDEMQGIVTS